MKSSSHVLLACMQAQELADDDGIDKRPVRVRTARMFLDGFEAIQRGEAGLDVPIFAAMSPIDKVCCWLDLPAACCSGHPHIAEVQCSRRAMVCIAVCVLTGIVGAYSPAACVLMLINA